jgi:hypothetical protein
MKKWLILLCVFVGLPIGALAQTTPVLAWEHDGASIVRFELVVDGGAAQSLGLPTPSGTTYTAPLPSLSAGAHVLELRACNDTFCSSAQTLAVVVLAFP